MDEFKKYLRENRHLLDVESPPRGEVWQRVQEHVPAKSKMFSIPLKAWMAAACVVLLTGTAIYMLWPSQPITVAGHTPETQNPKPETQNSKPDTALKHIGRADSSAPAISPLPGEVIAEKDEADIKKSLEPVASTRRKKSRPALSKELTVVDLLEKNYAGIINTQLKKLESTPIRVESPGYFHAFKKQWYDMEKDEKKIKNDISLYGLNDAVLTQFIQLYQQKLMLLKQLQDEINKMNNRAQQYPQMQTKSPSFLKM